MKRKCPQCGKKHQRNRLDVLTATYLPTEFCSVICENAYKIFNTVGKKQVAKIMFKGECPFIVGMVVKIGGVPMKIEAINENIMDVCKYV